VCSGGAGRIAGCALPEGSVAAGTEDVTVVGAEPTVWGRRATCTGEWHQAADMRQCGDHEHESTRVPVRGLRDPVVAGFCWA
jgi:hypothetical protein